MIRHSIDRINYLNILLMLVSGALAMRFPFVLFLFSYAVLGPLHYLTEISWLHDRKYFMKGRYDHFILGAFCLFLILPPIILMETSQKTQVAFIYILVALAGVFATTSSWPLRARLIACALFFLPMVLINNLLLVVFGLLLPTIIHVFVFTGFFILAGTIKQKSVSGTLSLVVFLAVSVGLLLWRPAGDVAVSDYVRLSYGESSDNGLHGFIAVNYVLLHLLMPDSFSNVTMAAESINAFLYHHPAARSVMSFIAFAYTYHYLNWFSKTTVIGWHKMVRKQLLIIVAIWGASLGLYLADYHVGARWLYTLSFLHVVLELPLNHLTIRSVVNSLRGTDAKPA